MRPAPRSPSPPPNAAPRSERTRHDVQALRVVAVVAVVLEHVLQRPAGGFVGVDVFFVISGFLITGHLLAEADATGRIALVSFVRRRVRRLGPAAVVVLAGSVLVGWAVLPGGRRASTVVDAAWAVLLAANARFVEQGTGYFDADTPPSPLQHFWSLAVEEQFYLVLPSVLTLLLVALVARGLQGQLRRWAAAVLSVVVAGSFAWALVQTASSPGSAYFSTSTRAWELGVGALLAAALPTAPRLPDLLRRTLGWLGMAVIVASAIVLDPATPFPAPGALLPVAGAALVIATSVPGSRTGVARLGLGPGAAVAAASYSIYLWHFPVLVLASAALPSVHGTGLAATVLGLTAVLATGSYLLVEQPVLRSPWLDDRPTPRTTRAEGWREWRRLHARRYRNGGLTALVAISLGLLPFALAQRAVAPLPPVAALTDQAAQVDDPALATPERAALRAEVESALALSTWPALSPSLDDLLAANRAYDASVDPRQKRLLDCASPGGNRPSRADCTVGAPDAAHRAVLVGDSTAGFSFPTWAAVAETSTTWSVEDAARSACPYVDLEIDLGEDIAPCREHVRQVQQRLLADPPDRLLVTNTYAWVRDGGGADVSGAQWRAHLLPLLEPLAAAGTQVVIVAPPPSSANVKECYTRTSTPSDCVSTTPGHYRERAAADEQVAEQLGGVYVATESLWCLDARCPAFIGTTPTKFDFAHLTLAMAIKVAPAFREVLSAAGVEL